MKKIEAIIRTERVEEVKASLKSMRISGMTVYSVSGWSKGKEENLQWKGHSVVHDLIAKSKLEVIVPDSQLKATIDTITKNARTGVHGDGIIFVLPVEQVVSIMTLDTGDKAIT